MTSRRRSSVARTRSGAYQLARGLGWVRAAQTGRLPQRTANVVIGRSAGKILRGLWR